MTNILVDRHHADLLESLHKLFEDRLGMTVYVPAGMDWQQQGYWRFGQGYPDGGAGVAKQFLVDSLAVDDLQPHRTLRLLTLEEAQGMDFALVMATVPDNYDGFARFAKEKGARFGIEVGNVNQWVDMRLDPFVLDSTGVYGHGTPFTPEFDMDGAFAYRAPNAAQRVSSFVNLFPRLPCFGQFGEVISALPMSWAYRVYGHDGLDAFIKPTSDIADLMGQSSFGWHDKISGDGFGYVIHYWASVGRPLIGHASHYRGQVAADLWEDGVTCIDLDKHSPAETARLMEEIVADRDRHEEMCFTIAQRVRERIDFAADAQRVAEALGLLVTA